MIEQCFAVKLNWKALAVLADKNKSSGPICDFECPFENEATGIVPMNEEEVLLLMDFALYANPDDVLVPLKHALFPKASTAGKVSVMFTKKFHWPVDTKEKCWFSKTCALTKFVPFCKQLLFTSLYWSGRHKNWTNLRFTTSSGSVRASPRFGTGDLMIDLSLPVEEDADIIQDPKHNLGFAIPPPKTVKDSSSSVHLESIAEGKSFCSIDMDQITVPYTSNCYWFSIAWMQNGKGICPSRLLKKYKTVLLS
jgi:hypothetical protein